MSNLSSRRNKKINKYIQLFIFIILAANSLFLIDSVADEFDKATGYVIQRNFLAAIKELEPLAKNGNEKAQIRIAIYYTKREIHDSSLAKYWITQAANKNNPEAQEMLGIFLMCGSFNWIKSRCHGDFDQARKWFLQAFSQYQKMAQSGNCKGYERLANFYFKGLIVPRDIEQGISNLKSASICGDVDAPIRLASLYTSENNDFVSGFPIDYIKGYAWSIIAAFKDYDYGSAVLRDNLERRLLPDQIRLGQQLARDCIDTNYQRCRL